jgi:hypothetical protein
LNLAHQIEQSQTWQDMKVDLADELLVGLDVLKGCYGLDSRRRLEVVLLAHGFAAREDEVGNGRSDVLIL